MNTSAVVIVVEDDDSMRRAIERLLDAAGIRTASYASAEECLAAGPDPDAICIVSDLRLPGMSGLDLLAQLHATKPLLPAVIITAHASPELRAQAMQRGASALLSKPFRGAELVSAIDRAVALQGPA